MESEIQQAKQVNKLCPHPGVGARFARQVIFNRPPSDDKQTTTNAFEVCDAEPIVMDPTTQSIAGVPPETIQHANHPVDDLIRRWVRSERHRSGE